MSLPAGAWTLDATHPVLRLQTQVKGRPFTLTAPIHSADLLVGEELSLTMGIAIDKVSTGSFLLDAGLRGFLVGHGAHELLFSGTGATGAEGMHVSGLAEAGQVAVEMALELQEFGSALGSLTVEVRGNAVFQDVNVPVPGIGSLSELVLEVQVELGLIAGR